MVESLRNDFESNDLMDIKEDLNALKKSVEGDNSDSDVYENLKNFDFNFTHKSSPSLMKYSQILSEITLTSTS